MLRVLAACSAGFCAAVGLAVFFPGCSVALTLLCSGLFAASFLPLPLKGTGKRLRLIAGGALCALGWVALWTAWFVAPVQRLDGQTLRLHARVLEYPRQSMYGCSALVRARLPSGGQADARLYLDEQGLSLQPGDEVETVAFLSYAGLTQSGDTAYYETARGVFLRARAYGHLEVYPRQGPNFPTFPARLAQRPKQSIRAVFPEDAAPLVLSIVTGDRSLLSPESSSALSRAGLGHVAAVSGMHLSFLTGALYLLLGRGRVRSVLLVTPVVLLFVLMTGCTPSVVRAGVMLLLCLCAPLFDRQPDSLTALAFALMLLLMQNPLAAAHVGLQLSFASVAGLFLVGQSLSRRWARLREARREQRERGEKRKKPIARLLRVLEEYLRASLCASLGALSLTLPLMAFHFSSLSLAAPVSNLLCLWAVEIIFSLGLFSGLLGLAVPALGRLLALPATLLVRLLEAALGLLSALPYASVRLEGFYLRAWLGFTCVLIVWLISGRGRRRLALPAVLCALALVSALLLTRIDFQRGDLAVIALDVGQGQCLLLRVGENLTVVDCGGDRYENAGDLAADSLRDLGIFRVDQLVLTHYDTDHTNGLAQLFHRLEIGTLLLPDNWSRPETREAVEALAREAGTVLCFVREDWSLRLGDAGMLTVYAPLSAGSSNDGGLCVLARAGGCCALATGDLSAEGEHLLLAHADLPRLSLLIAGHHGSADASSEVFLERTCPESVFISAGKDNQFGHPAAQTLERLAAAGAEVYRTDLQGTLTFCGSVVTGPAE